MHAAVDAAQAVFVLLTPDDAFKANLLFEAGMAFGLKPSRTVVVVEGDAALPAAISAMAVLRLNNSPASRAATAHWLEDAGCPVDRGAMAQEGS